MTHWANNPEAAKRVGSLLRQAGVPLEIKVADVCTRFAATAHGDLSGDDGPPGIWTDRVIYMDPHADETLRELDQALTIYDEHELSQHLGLAISVEVLIECKHRTNTEVFGFRHYSYGRGPARIPMISTLPGAELIRSAGQLVPSIVEKGPVSRIVFLKFDDVGSPKSIHEENVLFNAGSAIYDFIRANHAASPAVDLDAKRLGLLRNYEAFRRSSGYGRRWALQHWLKRQPRDVYATYNSVALPSRLFHSVGAMVPVVCVDSPLHEVVYGDSGEIQSFRQVDAIATGVRVRGWPKTMEPWLCTTAAEGLVLITTPAGLPAILESTLDYFHRLCSHFHNQTEDSVERAPLEGAMHESICATHDSSQDRRFYRSDLGQFEAW